MLKKKYIGVALAGALALGAFSGSAFAALTDVNGVMIDKDSPSNLTIDAVNFRESSVNDAPDVLSGYGRLASINGTDQSTFCPGCNVNFTFTYTVKSVDRTGPNPKVVFEAGTIKFFVDNTSSFDVNDPTTAGIGTPWLTLSGHTAPRSGFDDLGQLYATIYSGSVSTPGDSSGYGLLDATGGPSMSYFDTNFAPDGADFAFNSSFLTNPFTNCKGIGPSPADQCHYPISGTAELIAKAPTRVPEPGPAGMLGVGLAVIGLLLGRRRKEAAGRA